MSASRGCDSIAWVCRHLEGGRALAPERCTVEQLCHVVPIDWIEALTGVHPFPFVRGTIAGLNTHWQALYGGADYATGWPKLMMDMGAAVPLGVVPAGGAGVHVRAGGGVHTFLHQVDSVKEWLSKAAADGTPPSGFKRQWENLAKRHGTLGADAVAEKEAFAALKPQAEAAVALAEATTNARTAAYKAERLAEVAAAAKREADAAAAAAAAEHAAAPAHAPVAAPAPAPVAAAVAAPAVAPGGGAVATGPATAPPHE